MDFFDYGCGRGSDIANLKKDGFVAHGWDPYFQKENALHEAEVVNLGFVLNVIEDRDERNQALINAFKLTKKVLVVGVMLLANRHLGQPYKDGFLTSKEHFKSIICKMNLRHI